MLPDIKYYQEFGGEKIIFEKEETAKIKRIVDQGTYTCTYRCKYYSIACISAQHNKHS